MDVLDLPFQFGNLSVNLANRDFELLALTLYFVGSCGRCTPGFPLASFALGFGPLLRLRENNTVLLQSSKRIIATTLKEIPEDAIVPASVLRLSGNLEVAVY
jgi:hypothetical protein